MIVLYQRMGSYVAFCLVAIASSGTTAMPMLSPTEGSGEGSTVNELLTPVTTTVPTIVSTSTMIAIPTPTPGQLNDNTAVATTSFVVGIADVAIDVVILVLLLLMLVLLVRLLRLYGKYNGQMAAVEEGREAAAQGLGGREGLQAGNANTVLKTDAASQTIPVTVPPNPVIGELGEVLRRRTVHKASATSVGRKDSPEPQREVQQLRVGLTSLEEDKRLTSGSAEESAKLSGVVRSGVLKAEETQKRGREGQVEGQTGEQETNKIKDSSPATTTTTTTTTLTKASTTTTTATTINPTTPTSAAEAINTSRSAIGEGASKSSVEEEPVAVAPKTGKKEKRKTFKFKKSGKDKRYKQKEMEDEVAEPPAHMEVNPELVLLLKMTPLVEDKEEEDEVTDL